MCPSAEMHKVMFVQWCLQIYELYIIILTIHHMLQIGIPSNTVLFVFQMVYTRQGN